MSRGTERERENKHGDVIVEKPEVYAVEADRRSDHVTGN